jgi:hypothetical protein
VLISQVSQHSKMKILLQCLLILSCNALAFSAEILAWKTPISRIDTGGKASPRLERLDKPPEASPFFGKDDELWNVSFIMPNDEEVTDKLEWAVWNATSGRLVAKGSWVALFELQRHYDLENPPVQCRLKLDVYQVPADGSPPDGSKQPSFSLSYIVRSGQKVVASNTEGDSSISVESETFFGDYSSVIDTRIFSQISLPNCPNLQIDSSISIENQVPVWFARNFNGKQGVDLMVTGILELADGTPFQDVIMRQEGDNMKPFSISDIHDSSGNIALGEKHRLVWLRPPVGALEYLDNQKLTDKDVDPFSGEKIDINKRLKFKEVKAPDILSPHFYGMVFDISDALKQNGIKVLDKDFAGYDPKTFGIFMYSSDIAELDKFEQLFMVLDGEYINRNVVITSRGDGEMRLISRSGQKSSLSSLDLQSKKSRHFEVEPGFPENGSIIDLRCNFSEKIGEETIQSLDTSVTLEAGKFLKLFEKGKADGTKEAMEVKAEVFKHEH